MKPVIKIIFYIFFSVIFTYSIAKDFRQISNQKEIIFQKNIDLNHDGILDKILILNRNNKQVLYIKIKNKIIENSNILPCVDCGNNIDYILKVNSKGLTIEIEGGGWERWQEKYHFIYNKKINNFQLDKAELYVVNTSKTNKVKQIIKKDNQLPLILLTKFDRFETNIFD